MNRRHVLQLGLSGLAVAACHGIVFPAEPAALDVQEQLLAIANEQQRERRARFAAVQSQADLQMLQRSLRESFLRLIGGLPTSTEPPPVQKLGEIEADDYRVEKLLIESFPGYFVTALLYRPKQIDGRLIGDGFIRPRVEGREDILQINRLGFVVAAYQYLDWFQFQ